MAPHRLISAEPKRLGGYFSFRPLFDLGDPSTSLGMTRGANPQDDRKCHFELAEKSLYFNRV